MHVNVKFVSGACSSQNSFDVAALDCARVVLLKFKRQIGSCIQKNFNAQVLTIIWRILDA